MKKFLLLSFLIPCFTLVIGSAPAWILWAQGSSSSESSPSGSQTFKILVNKANPVSELKRVEVSNYLLKKKISWPHEQTVQPVDLSSRSEIRAAMSQTIHQRSVASIKNYWQRQIFAGHNTPPPEMDEDDKVIAHIAKYPGAIGYVATGTRTPDTVKVVSVSFEP